MTSGIKLLGVSALGAAVVLWGSSVIAGSCGGAKAACGAAKAACSDTAKEGGSACSPEQMKACAAKGASCGANASECSAKTVKDEGSGLSAADLKAVVDSGSAVTILDARSGKYDDGKRIPGAKSLTADASAEEISKLLPSKDAEVVTYCSNLKCGASKALADRLRKEGYSKVRELPVGIAGWEEAGYSVDTVKN